MVTLIIIIIVSLDARRILVTLANFYKNKSYYNHNVGCKKNFILISFYKNKID